jgi:hypothetical protein
MTMLPLIAGEKADRWAMPQGRHGLFRFGAFVAARGHRPSINVRISPPEHHHAYNAGSFPQFRFSHLLARPRYAFRLDVQVTDEIAYHLYPLDIVVRDFHASESVLDCQHQLNAIDFEIVSEVRLTYDKLNVNAELSGNECEHR